MYTSFYGLREKPFSLTPNPRYLFLADSHREALAHLLYGIDQGEGFIAITGEVGTGKTTLCRTLLERLGAETEVAFLFNPSGSAEELLKSIFSEFALATAERTRSELLDELNRFLLEKKREGRRVLLIIDESQNLSGETLEQVRLLSNLETSTSKLIQILLLGQPELDRKLDSPELRQLRQRISVRWHLAPLKSAETAEYVRHRLRVSAGASREIFSAGALRAVHQHTGGVPRLINVLCDRALLAGFATQRHELDARMVRRVAAEIRAESGTSAWRRRRGFRSRPGLAWGVAAGSATVAAALLGFELWRTWGGASVPATSALEDPAGVGAALPVAAVSAPPPFPNPSPQAHTSETAGHAFAAAAELSQSPQRAEPRADVERVIAMQSAGAEPLVEQRSQEPGDSNYLVRLLAEQDPWVVRALAFNEVLAAYELEGLAPAPSSIEDAVVGLEDRGLRVLWLEDSSLELLRILNHPALLVISTPDGSPRIVALQRLDGEVATLVGAAGADALPVHVSELELEWEGEALVVWQEFEETPEVISLGGQGGAVLWLQNALAELGYYADRPSGYFDEATREGVRALQSRHSLVPDGDAGPRTQMLLYDLLGRYEVPRLAERGRSG